MIKNKVPVVYTPGSPLAHPLQLLKELLIDIRTSFYLTRKLAGRDISAQYRQTALGYFWAVFPPLVTSLTFIILNRASIIDVKNISVPYPVYVITGTIFWQLFVDALNAPLKSVAVNRAMLTKINFQKEAIIFSGIAQVLFSFAIKLILLTGVLIGFKVNVQLTAVFLLLPAVGLLAIGTLCGVFLVPIGVLYEDVQQGLLIAASALMFLTPVIYPPPETGALAKIIEFNPIAPLLMLSKEMLFNEKLTYLMSACCIIAITLLLLFVMMIFYRVALPNLIERMEA